MKLVVPLPTRGRPALLLATLRTMLRHAVLDTTAVTVQVDADDAATVAAASQCEAIDRRITVDVRPREDTIAGKINRAMAIRADAYMVGADDDAPVTPGWDARILEAAARFPDGIAMVYGRMANASFPGKYAPTAKLVELMGFIQPELFPYWFVDHWTDDLARIIGRISFADVASDQSAAGKTQEMREPGWWATWFDAAYLVRRRQAHAIIDNPAFDVPPYLKDVLRTHHPLIEYRSRWINDSVRVQARQLEGWSGLSTADARYQRVKAKAVAMIPHLLDGMDPVEAAMFRSALIPPTEVVNLKMAFA